MYDFVERAQWWFHMSKCYRTICSGFQGTGTSIIWESCFRRIQQIVNSSLVISVLLHCKLECESVAIMRAVEQQAWEFSWHMIQYINLLQFIFTYQALHFFKDLLLYRPICFMSQIPSYWGALGVRVGANILAFYNRCYRTLGDLKICLMRILMEHIRYIKQLSPVRGNNLNNSSECY